MFFAAQHSRQCVEVVADFVVGEAAEDLRASGGEQFGVFPDRVGDQKSEEVELVQFHHAGDFGGEFLLPLMEEFEVGLLHLGEGETD